MAPCSARRVLRAALAALPLLAPGAAAADGTCAPGVASNPDGTCAVQTQGSALLQLERKTVVHADHASLVEDSGFCCFYPTGPTSCGQCGSKAPAGSWCAASQNQCRTCSGTWCTGGDAGTAAAQKPTTAPAPASPPTPAAPGASAFSEGRLLWADEFDGHGVDRSKWTFRIGTNPSNQELQYYTDRPANAEVSGGTLKLVGKCEQYNGMAFTASRMHSTATWGPGTRVEVRARLPDNKGTWPAIWMLPRDNAYGGWPNSGEIDIMESVGCDPNRVHGTIHSGDYNWMKNSQKSGSLGLDVTSWHVYSVTWTSSQITFLVDGSPYFSFSRQQGATSGQWPFDKPFYLILNNAVGGSWGGMCLGGKPPSCSDPSQFGQPQIMEVDYARVYAM